MFTVKLFMLLLFSYIFLYPLWQYIRTWDKFNFTQEYIDTGFDYDRSINPFETLPGLHFEGSDDATLIEFEGCGNTSFYLGDADVYQDCVGQCKSKDYQYIFLTDKQSMVVHGQRLRGAYCVPKAYARCNLNTSTAVVGLTGYQCVTSFPSLLGGPSGNEIIGCRSGVLEDRLLRQTYTHYVPNNLSFDSVDDRLADGRYRFECGVDESSGETVDNIIHFPSNVGTRFESARNPCSLFDPSGEFSFESMRCKCNNTGGGLTASGTCTTCTSGFGFGDSKNVHGAAYAHSIGRQCVDPTTATRLESQLAPVPCGKSTLERVLRCERAQLNLTNSYTPMALENMFG